MPPPTPPLLELASNFVGESLLMWKRLGESHLQVERRVDAPTLEPFWLRGGAFDPSRPPRKTPFQEPGSDVVKTLDPAIAKVTFNLYRRPDPGPFVPADLLTAGILNSDNDFPHYVRNSGWNRQKIVARAPKAMDFTFYYALTTVLDGVESVLAASPVLAVLSAEETSVEADDQSVKGVQRTFNITVPAGTISPVFVIVDFVTEMGFYARSVSINNTGAQAAQFRPNNLNNEAIFVPAGAVVNFRKNELALFRLLFENLGGAPATLQIIAIA